MEPTQLIFRKLASFQLGLLLWMLGYNAGYPPDCWSLLYYFLVGLGYCVPLKQWSFIQGVLSPRRYLAVFGGMVIITHMCVYRGGGACLLLSNE